MLADSLSNLAASSGELYNGTASRLHEIIIRSRTSNSYNQGPGVAVAKRDMMHDGVSATGSGRRDLTLNFTGLPVGYSPD
jgi:hypothetical protein